MGDPSLYLAPLDIMSRQWDSYQALRQMVSQLSTLQLEEIVKTARTYSKQFYQWRKKIALRKNLKIHRRAACPFCYSKITREKTGKKNCWSYYCSHCQIHPRS